jgi:hypothetical protein
MERPASQDGEVTSTSGRETDQTDRDSTDSITTPNIDSLQVCRAVHHMLILQSGCQKSQTLVVCTHQLLLF